MAEIDDQILTMTEAELDNIPTGIIRLDRNGKILYYNRSQAELAHRDSKSTVGLNFFREVAPCAAVKDFQGRFEEFVNMLGGSKIEPFSFTFRFAWGGEARVTITMVRSSRSEESYFIVVHANTDKKPS
jgi:photoactive yellow protein